MAFCPLPVTWPVAAGPAHTVEGVLGASLMCRGSSRRLWVVPSMPAAASLLLGAGAPPAPWAPVR